MQKYNLKGLFITWDIQQGLDLLFCKQTQRLVQSMSFLHKAGPITRDPGATQAARSQLDYTPVWEEPITRRINRSPCESTQSEGRGRCVAAPGESSFFIAASESKDYRAELFEWKEAFVHSLYKAAMEDSGKQVINFAAGPSKLPRAVRCFMSPSLLTKHVWNRFGIQCAETCGRKQRL